jgi:hypothetical protein
MHSRPSICCHPLNRGSCVQADGVSPSGVCWCRAAPDSDRQGGILPRQVRGVAKTELDKRRATGPLARGSQQHTVDVANERRDQPPSSAATRELTCKTFVWRHCELTLTRH